MISDFRGKLFRALRKPPHVVAMRLLSESRAQIERYVAPRRAHRWGERWLLQHLSSPDIDTLWLRLGGRAFPACFDSEFLTSFELDCPGGTQRIQEAARRALAGEVDLLGSGPFVLDQPVAWHRDHKSGFGWPNQYAHDIEYNNLERPSDVKMAWELSRMQWLIPVGQAYLLDPDDRYASAVKGYLEDWMLANPYAGSVNWSCTMEVALRVVVFGWLFHAFKDSDAWRDQSFRMRFLTCLFLHGDYTDRHIERSDINGNHYTADAAGLVFSGLFFGEGCLPRRWLKQGWQILENEMDVQVCEDGIDYEMSSAYHRLVLELFFLPALYRLRHGLDVHASYRRKLLSMAGFIKAYSKPDGRAPLWGDADDARVLPFGGQHLNDHRYLAAQVEYVFTQRCVVPDNGSEELFWLLGPDAASASIEPDDEVTSQAFPDGGCYVMRSLGGLGHGDNHVFADCGPIGLKGRGGHGHNDCLSFEAVLGGVRLVTDCGAYLYTASYEWRNRFRSSAFHSTPTVDGEELNRFIDPSYLWNLHYDAVPQVRYFETGPELDRLQASHSGFCRLADPVTPIRTWVLDKLQDRLLVFDRISGSSLHRFTIPYQLDPTLRVGDLGAQSLDVNYGSRTYRIQWIAKGSWRVRVEQGWVSESYGLKQSNQVLVFECEDRSATLAVAFVPAGQSLESAQHWMEAMCAEADDFPVPSFRNDGDNAV
ncbi:MAG: alginate lyase family protein [Gammaproteobacteria bacterium]|nr:alginate lyase family protein [Gammaproteobacteria bacterium]MCP5135973.1 alginate lyase family protein [Gammaproteobacteria bacterium]